METLEEMPPNDNEDTNNIHERDETRLGWGYVIVISNFLVMLTVFGLMQSQSFFFVEWQEYFDASAADISFLTSLSLLLLGLLSPIGGMLSTIFGSRPIVMLGGVLASLGMLLSMFCNTMTGLYLTWGLLMGLGFALIYSPSVAMLGKYFDRYLTTVNGIMLTGGSLGMIVAPLTDVLINAYGWRNAMLILSALLCNLIAIGATLRVPPPILWRKTNKSLEGVRQKTSDSLSQERQTRDEDLERVGENISILRILLDLACNARFMIVLLVFLLLGLVLLAPCVHVIARAEKAGLSRADAAILPTLIGIGNLAGRLSGFFVDSLQLRQDVANIGSFILCTITYFINPFCNSFWTQVLYAVVFGFGQGTVIVCSFVLAQVLIEEKHRAVGVGFVTMCLFAGYTIGIVLVGWLYDISGGYDVPFFTMGVISVAGTFLIIIVSIMSKRTK